MDDHTQKDANPFLAGSIPPPKDLPDFFKQEKTAPIVPPVPPQLHPFPQPKIVVAPPTPCPLTSPTEPSSTSHFPLPENGLENVLSSGGDSTAEASSADIRINKSVAPSSKTVSIGLSEAEHQLGKLENTEEESSVLGWLQKRVNNSSFLSKVADKAKTSMDSVLTTLDPGMKDFLKREGSLDIVVASDNIRIITALADGFRKVFTSVSYRGMGTPGATHLQSQIVGHSLALKYMNERITLLRASGLATPKSAVVVFQPFLHEIEGEWYESAVIGVQVASNAMRIFGTYLLPKTNCRCLAYLILQKNTDIIHVFTQPIQVENAVMDSLRSHTPKEYPSNAFSITIGNAYAEIYGIDPDDWQLARYSVSSSESYRLASAMLAHSFKEKYSCP